MEYRQGVSPQYDASRFLPPRAVLGEILSVVIKNTRIYKNLPVQLGVR